MKNYLICASPRTGSNMLCELLSSLGFAGRPEEHFWQPEGTELEPLVTRWPAVLEVGTGPNGVFGVKLMYYQAERLEGELPALLGMPDRPLSRVLSAMLDDPAYVYLTRRDRLRQAISLTRAMQTSQWRSMDASRQAPVYDAEAIQGHMAWLQQEEATWEVFFRRNGITPYRLIYEDLTADPPRTITDLLRFLGHDASGDIVLPAPQHQRQADELTEQWVRRYQADIT